MDNEGQIRQAPEDSGAQGEICYNIHWLSLKSDISFKEMVSIVSNTFHCVVKKGAYRILEIENNNGAIS